MENREQKAKNQAVASQPGRNMNVATEEDVYAKQEKLYTGGTSELPS